MWKRSLVLCPSFLEHYLLTLTRRISLEVPAAARDSTPIRASNGSSPAVFGSFSPPAFCPLLLPLLPGSAVVDCDGVVGFARVFGVVDCEGSLLGLVSFI